MQKSNVLRKHLPLDELLQRRQQIEDVNYWRGINPRSTISTLSLAESRNSQDSTDPKAACHAMQLREEGYFQTSPIIPDSMLQEMRECIEIVRRHGFPVMFSLVYDVFYSVFSYFDSILTHILGSEYKLIPNFWVYYIDPTDAGKGFEPHRDAEYVNTIDAHGMPTVLTLWVTITDATPLNSCMYILPKDRDPQYNQAIHDLKTNANQLALEDIRALPTKAGILSCWDQYVFHWGSRSSKRAPHPRISYAMYCQRGDVDPVDNAIIDMRNGIDFKTRLEVICKGMHRYSYLSVQSPDPRDPLLSFLERHIANLKNV
ncbi:MAG: mitomycin antibiotics/polyketide fumonisin biosynthesis protein [Gammaproteobacteria bacterium]|nr:mitomycin antibiotics/polyketide fumonisin biosynthesis protein [Gammaproteobacteria bacterium]